MKNLHGESTNSKKHSKSAPQTLNDRNSQKTSHHQYTHSKILDSTPKKNHNPHKTQGGNKNLETQSKPRKQLTQHPVTTTLAQTNQKQTNKGKRKQGKDKNNARTKCKSERIRLNTANAVIDTTQESLSENSRAPLRK